MFGRKRLFDQLYAQLFQRRSNFVVMLTRPGFVRVDEQSCHGRSRMDSFNSGKIELVASEFKLQAGGVPVFLCRRRHCLRRIETDRKRGFDFRNNRNVCQFPDAFAGTLRFQVPQRAVQRIACRAGGQEFLEECRSKFFSRLIDSICANTESVL